MKTLALTAALFAGSIGALATSPASAQHSGNFHHTQSGVLGSSQHFDYGDLHHNQQHIYQGSMRPTSNVNRTRFRGNSSRVRYTGPVNSAGHPTGHIRPGMVLPDGAIVVCVGG